MKVKISSFPTFWVKVCALILMFFSIGLASIQAQNYKPYDEAVAAVDDAHQDLVAEKFVKARVTPSGSGGHVNATAMSPAQGNAIQLKVFEVSYYKFFLNEAKSSGDVATAVQALDAFFNAQGQPPVRNAIIVAARADLMELITY